MYVISDSEENIDKLSDPRKATYGKNNNRITSIIEMSKIVMGQCYDVDNNPVNSVWKSFDDTTYNFHITPKEREKSKLIKSICNQLNERLRTGRMPWTRNFWWIKIEKGEYIYMLAFQSLVYEKNVLNCYWDRIQFYKYKTIYKGINWGIDGKFKIQKRGLIN